MANTPQATRTVEVAIPGDIPPVSDMDQRYQSQNHKTITRLGS